MSTDSPRISIWTWKLNNSDLNRRQWTKDKKTNDSRQKDTNTPYLTRQTDELRQINEDKQTEIDKGQSIKDKRLMTIDNQPMTKDKRQ